MSGLADAPLLLRQQELPPMNLPWTTDSVLIDSPRLQGQVGAPRTVLVGLEKRRTSRGQFSLGGDWATQAVLISGWDDLNFNQPHVQPEFDKHSALGSIDRAYIVYDREKTLEFIEANRLLTILLEANDPLKTSFGKSAIKALSLLHDEEGAVTLFCMILVPGNAETARQALDRFDEEWWLERCQRVAGQLNFDIEFI